MCTVRGTASERVTYLCTAFVYVSKVLRMPRVPRMTCVRNGRHVVDVYSARSVLFSRARRLTSDLYVYVRTQTYLPPAWQGEPLIALGKFQAESGHAIQCVAQLQAC